MKRELVAPQAEEMYVCRQMEFKEIATALGVSERTLRDWAKRGSWKDKRQAYISDLTALDHQLLRLSLKLTIHLIDTLDSDGELTLTKVQLLGKALDHTKPKPTIKPANAKEISADDADKPAQNPLDAVKQYLRIL